MIKNAIDLIAHDRAVNDALDLIARLDSYGAELVRKYRRYRIHGDGEPFANVEPEPFPRLPSWASLPVGLGSTAGKWLDLYVQYAQAISPMTPRIFHESAALWLVSLTIARRLVLPMAHGDVYPNLWVLWLAPTTLYRKTTALDIPRKIAHRVIPHLLAAQDTTPEALLSDMAGIQPANLMTLPEAVQSKWQEARNYPAQKGLVYDELSGLIAGAGKDYNAGLVEDFLRFYDCTPEHTRSSRGQGLIVIKDAYLSILGASTPTALVQHLAAERLWGMGWWPRFAILTPDGPPEWKEAQNVPEPPELAGKLREIDRRLPAAKYPEPPQAVTVSLGAGVFDAWQQYNKAVSFDLLVDSDLHPSLTGTYGRLPTQALKVATILATFDWQPNEPTPRIELPHLARALDIVETWRASAHRAVETATTREGDRVKERITRQLSLHQSDGLTLRDLVKLLKDVDRDKLVAALQELVDDAEVTENSTSGGRGRPTTRYMLSK